MLASRPDIACGMVFNHHKGGIYQVRELTIDTDNGALRVSYFRIGGPNYDEYAEAGIIFSRRIEEWVEPRMVRAA